jgi:Zn finger protein HypA/HybF involved in hydrogenase expression
VNINRQIERVLRSHQDNDSPALNAALELLCDSLEDECPECERTTTLNESKTLCYSCQGGDEE